MAGHNKREKTQREDAWRRVRASHKTVEEVGEGQGLWYESPEEVEAQLARGNARALRLRWVTRQMERRLDARERRCVELFYLEGRSLREIAGTLGITKSAAERTIRGAIEKLRAARRMAVRRA